MKPNIESGATILLVDDERLVLSTLSMGLVRAGYRVVTAESVVDAEEFLASGERPDLVILDVRMPGTSGLVLAERLRSLDHVPFLLLTACSDQETVDRATASGALGYLVKPVDTPQLIPAIKAALARAREIHGLEETGRQLQKALNNEREISIATGITMAQYHLDRKAAFELLRKSARSQGRKLADLAAEIIRASEALNLGSE
jgi:response regulator NasT